MRKIVIELQYFDGSDRMGVFIRTDPPMAEWPESETYARTMLKRLVKISLMRFTAYFAWPWLSSLFTGQAWRYRKQMIDTIIEECRSLQSANAEKPLPAPSEERQKQTLT